VAEAGLPSADTNTGALPSGCLLADRSTTLHPGETCDDALLLVPKDALRMPTAAARMPGNHPGTALQLHPGRSNTRING